MKRVLASVFVTIGLAGPALADGFAPIKDRGTFMNLVEGKKLTRLGIALDVTNSGSIIGRAFGKRVTGAWRWNDGYFCRDLYYGNRDLGPNCQAVKVRGNTLRFISDRGEGIYADLKLR